MLAISDQRPEGLKGTFIRWAYLRSTMGMAIPLDIGIIDPTSARFMAAAATPAATPAAGAALAAAAASATATASGDGAAATAAAAPLA